MRKNPFIWDEAPAKGVLSPFEGSELGSDALNLLGLNDNHGIFTARDVRLDEPAGPEVYALLGRIAEALRAAAEDGRAWRYRIDHLSAQDQAMLLDALGHGEVTMVIAPGTSEEGEAQIYETVLPGVWIGQACDPAGDVQATWVEVADAPRAVREAAILRPREALDVTTLSPPRGAMNVMSVLAEISERAAAWRPGTENHVLNFTLFPMTPADSAFLAQVLGEVGVQISSGGYGAARVMMTGVRNVWAVQYLNGLGAVILDTTEIGDLPAAVLASREDFEDSAARLADIQEAYLP